RRGDGARLRSLRPEGNSDRVAAGQRDAGLLELHVPGGRWRGVRHGDALGEVAVDRRTAVLDLGGRGGAADDEGPGREPVLERPVSEEVWGGRARVAARVAATPPVQRVVARLGRVVPGDGARREQRGPSARHANSKARPAAVPAFHVDLVLAL